jgi:nucleotide-binding universal stress UspA family protein
MYDRILFPTDGSDPAATALEYALDLASAHGSTVRVLNVADTDRDSVTRIGGQVVDALVQEGERIVETAADRASERGVTTLTDVVQGDPDATIVDVADRSGTDLVVMATHGRRGIERILLGSVTERVLDATTTPVLTITPSEHEEGDATAAYTYPPSDVLVGIDGSRAAALALREAAALARATGARLHLCHVVETGGLGLDALGALDEDELVERGEATIDETVEAAGGSLDGVEVERSVVIGRAHRELRSYVDEHGVDLLVLGKGGETDLGRSIVGGVTAKLVRTSPVPLLTVPDAVADESDDEPVTTGAGAVDGAGAGDGEGEGAADPET